MCRSTAQGGRRCSGRSKTTVAVSPASATTAPVTSSAVPTREQVDQLAAKLPADRKDAFGKPLSESSRRMFALRESGYTGPIDSDGYPDTTSRGADVLRHMARDRGETVNW